jgi:hypothetical protein
MEEDELDRTFSIYKILARKPEGNTPHGIPKHR